MREIKFRFWDIKNKFMSGLYDLFDLISSELGFFDGSDIPMQYTGLKDINGKEIYEGDIVLDRQWYYGVIIIDKYGTGIITRSIDSVRDKMTKGNRLTRRDIFYKDELEKRGNIYENPDVLEADLSLRGFSFLEYEEFCKKLYE